jgi:putative ABC transport system permease protein
MFRELLKIALSQIAAGKGRSFLTILGIKIGIMTVILITTVLESYSFSITQDLSDLGTNVFQLQRYENGGFNRREREYRPPIAYESRFVIYEQCPSVRLVGAEYWSFGKEIRYKDSHTNPNVQLVGTTPEFTPNNAFTIGAGRDLTEDDLNSGRNVIVLGDDIVKKIFPKNISPVGQMVKMDGHPFRVIGLFQKKKEMTFGGTKNNLMAIPITTYAKLYGSANRTANVTIQANSTEEFDAAIEEVIGAIRAHRKVEPGKENNFYIYSNETVVGQFNETATMIKLIALVIGLISLLVGAIGVMNIMLVSVTERTKEIGIRKALGATKLSILAQFLFEAVILAVIGAILGILLGIFLGSLFTAQLNMSVVIPYTYLVMAVVVTSLIGIVAGIYPAWMASRQDPIDALRYE